MILIGILTACTAFFIDCGVDFLSEVKLDALIDSAQKYNNLTDTVSDGKLAYSGQGFLFFEKSLEIRLRKT